MRVLTGWQRFWRDSRGAEIAEFAMVSPLLFLFLLGIIQFGRLFNIYSTVHRAAQEGARVAGRDTCATCGSSFLGADVISTQFVRPVFNASHLDVSAAIAPNPTMYSCTNSASTVACDPLGVGSTPQICVQRDVILNTSGGAPGAGPYVCGTSVSVQYPVQFSIPAVSISAPYIYSQPYTFNLKSQVDSLEEN